jgi:hypothetical protein
VLYIAITKDIKNLDENSHEINCENGGILNADEETVQDMRAHENINHTSKGTNKFGKIFYIENGQILG